MKTLLELFEKYNNYHDVDYPSDKNSYHSYIEDVYEEYFSPYRDKKVDLLEIGVSYSGSIRLWNDYFEDATIYGVDNFSCGAEHKNKAQDLIDGEVDNVKIICKDAYDEAVSEELPQFDIIIDDGSHRLHDQIATYELLKDRMNPGGLFIIEDVANITIDAIEFEERHDDVEIYDGRTKKNRYDDCLIIMKF